MGLDHGWAVWALTLTLQWGPPGALASDLASLKPNIFSAEMQQHEDRLCRFIHICVPSTQHVPGAY